jgi:ABC-2 type transport system ATP-binding protein
MDEPFTGLDALVRDELIRGVLELSEDGGWTVLISSHDIDEVERLADRVAIIDAGRCRLEEPVGNLQARFRRMELVVTDRTTVPDRPPPEWLVVERAGTRLTFVHSDYSAEATPEELTRHLGVWQSDEATRMSLKEIFLALARTYDLHEGGRS